jgi:hypothetical protein
LVATKWLVTVVITAGPAAVASAAAAGAATIAAARAPAANSGVIKPDFVVFLVYHMCSSLLR